MKLLSSRVFPGLQFLFAFTLTAAMLLFTLVEAYIAVGGGIILLGFGGNRFTASAAEGYFPFVIRVGCTAAFLLPGARCRHATRHSMERRADSRPVSPWPPRYHFGPAYYVPPSKIMTTVCSGGLSTRDMLDYAIGALVFAIMTVGIPQTVASLVGGSIGLALAHAFEAAYIAQTIVSSDHVAGSKRSMTESPASQKAVAALPQATACRPPCRTY